MFFTAGTLDNWHHPIKCLPTVFYPPVLNLIPRNYPCYPQYSCNSFAVHVIGSEIWNSWSSITRIFGGIFNNVENGVGSGDDGGISTSFCESTARSGLGLRPGCFGATELICFTERFPLVLTRNKPVYDLALALTIHVGLVLTYYYATMPTLTMPTPSALSVNASGSKCSIQYASQYFGRWVSRLREGRVRVTSLSEKVVRSGLGVRRLAMQHYRRPKGPKN